MKNACGQTCVAMIASAALERRITPVDVARETGNDDNSFTTFAELLGMFRHYGIEASYQRPAGFNWWRDLLLSGGVGVALIDHAQHPNNGGYLFAHFIVVSGMTDTHIVTYNPLFPAGPTALNYAEFIACIGSPSRFVGGTNMPFQAVEVRIPRRVGVDLRDTADRLASVAGGIRQTAEAA